jgi:predicted TIM-barrel fold metal-dependent hydrolase
VKIVDAQVHIWAANTPARPWPKRHPPHRSEPFGADELLVEMDAAGIDGAVLVPPSWEGEYNDLITEAVTAHPDRFAAMALATPSDAPALMARWPFPSGVRGMRFAVHRPGLVEALTDGRMDAVWEAAEAHGKPLMVLLPHELVEMLGEVARRHPKLKLIIDHLGLVFAPGDPQEALRRVLPLAELPNIALKATSLPAYAPGASYPYAAAQPLVRDAVRAFGAQRVFWGTDVTRLPCSYRDAVRMVTEEMDFLSASELESVMGGGLCEWLGWEPVTPA